MIINCSKCNNVFEKGCKYSHRRRCPRCTIIKYDTYDKSHKKQQAKHRQLYKILGKRKIYDAKYYIKNMNKIKIRQRKTRIELRYDLTPEEYNLKLQQQNFVCAICNQSETRKNKNGKITQLSVDHDHITGQVRGLLCNRCNLVIGKNKENLDLFQKQINYLKQNKLPDAKEAEKILQAIYGEPN